MEEGKRTLIVLDKQMKPAEQWRRDWVVEADEGTTLEDIMQPVYWSYMAAQMTEFDRIEVRDSSHEWVKEFIVVQVDEGRHWARVKLLNEISLTGTQTTQVSPEKYEIKHGGNVHKWRVIRLLDHAVLQSGLPNREAANDWLRSYEKAVGA